MTLFLCSDVDGTIIDSRALVRRAYAEVGVDMPDDAWGRPWHEWLVELAGDLHAATRLHEAKVDAYHHVLTTANLRELELPAASVIRTLLLRRGPEAVRYLTSGTAETANVITARLSISASLFGTLRYRSRLAHLAHVPRGVIYLDDDVTTITRLREDAPHLRLVHVSEQSVDELSIEIARLGDESER